MDSYIPEISAHRPIEKKEREQKNAIERDGNGEH